MQAEILSLVALLIALASTVINYLLLRSQQDPEVVVYAYPDPRRPTVINLIIENIGKGIARDISFQADREIPWDAFGFDDAQMPKPMKRGPLVYGIPLLHPAERRIITWGQFGGITKGLENKPLDITARYFSIPRLRLLRQKHSTTSTIDMKSFEGTDASDDNWDKKAAEHLEKIAAVLKSAADPRDHSIRVTKLTDK